MAVIVKTVSVSAVFLNRIHCKVGIVKDTVTGLFSVGKSHTYAHGDSRKTVAGILKIFFQTVQFFLNCDTVLLGYICHNDGKLITAYAEYVIRTSEGRIKLCGCFSDDCITCCMPESIIEVLETVDIDQYQSIR